MNTPPLRHSISALLALVCAACVVPADADESGFVDLLAGDALTETWRGYRAETSPPAWRLSEGVLSLDGAGGDLITREQYGDFDLRFEWKISTGGNSGVMYLVSEDGDASYFSGPEYQLIDTDYGASLTDRQKPGALYDLYSHDPQAVKPAGAWNESRIVIRDGAVTHWLNGVEVVSAKVGSEDWNQRVEASKFAKWERFGRNAKGHLALQDHGDPVSFRNVRIKRLD